MRLAETTGVVMGGARTGDINNPKHVKTIGNPIRSKFFRCFGTVVVFAPGGQCFDFSEVRFSDLYRFFQHDFGTAQVFITNSWFASFPVLYTARERLQGCSALELCFFGFILKFDSICPQVRSSDLGGVILNTILQ